MNIDNCVGWYVDISVGVKVGRDHNEGLESDVGAEVGGGDGEGV